MWFSCTLGPRLIVWFAVLLMHVAADLITNPTLRCRFDVCVRSDI